MAAMGTERCDALARRRPDADTRNVTLIVFCREPLAGHTKTRLIPRLGAAHAAELAGAFILDALSKCHALAPGRIVIAASAPDGAETATTCAAPRAASAPNSSTRAAAVSAHGWPGARAVSLRRRSAHRHRYAVAAAARCSREASRCCGRAPVVIAPSLDGGYYLVGVRGPMPEIFRVDRLGTLRCAEPNRRAASPQRHALRARPGMV